MVTRDATEEEDVERIEGKLYSLEFIQKPDDEGREPGSYVTIYVSRAVPWASGDVVIERSRLQPAAASEAPSDIFVHATPKCDHEFAGWRNFDDGNGGEQICTKCGIGAMSASLRDGP